VSSCFHYQIKQCRGVCRNEEDIESYNKRVLDAIASAKYDSESFIIKEKGRTKKEIAFVLVANSTYKGYGYLPISKVDYEAKEYLEALVAQKDNNDIKRILNSYLKNDTDNLISLDHDFIDINFNEDVLSNQII
jgi:DNA polymerase-3 subunit epsilon